MSNHTGVIAFHAIEGTGLSTTVEGIATCHEFSGRSSKVYEVPADTPASICEKYAPQTFHLLKIDVEGAAEKVLRDADFNKIRPWIVLVEATEPLSDASSHLGWDPLLAQAGYEFVLFDGLNRFYIARDQDELKPFFSIKGDAYQTIGSIWTIGNWRKIAEERDAEIARVGSEMERIGAKRDAALQELSSTRQELAAIKNSRWWRGRTQTVSLARRARGR